MVRSKPQTFPTVDVRSVADRLVQGSFTWDRHVLQRGAGLGHGMG